MNSGKFSPALAFAVLESFDDAIVVMDTTGRVHYANLSSRDITACEPDELLGRSCFSLIHPDDVPEVQRLFGLLLDHQWVPATIEFRIRRQPDQWIPVETTGALVEAGGDQFVVASMRESRTRDAVEKQLRYEAEFLRTLLRQVQVGIVACDADGRVVAFNEHLRQHHRQPDGREVIGSWIRNVQLFESDGITPMPPEKAPLFRAFRGERVHNLEYAALTMDGTVRFRRANGERMVDHRGQVLGAFVAVEDITGQRAAEEALRRQALYDPLTGLPNRILLTERLLSAIARSTCEADAPVLFFLDLDNFKVVNDSLGHSAGDRLLVEIAKRLTDLCGPATTVARLGGDEFVISTERFGDDAEIISAAQQIIDAVTEPVSIDANDVRVTASIGVAVCHGPHDTAERLLRDADTAMYLAKDNGRNRWEIFDRSLREAVLRRMDAEQSLRKAIDDGRLRVVFQPIVAANSREVIGFEALARYQDESGAVIPPEEFVPVAEQTGLISRIDMFVFEEACRLATAVSVPERMGTSPYVSCNFSAATLTREDLVPVVLGQLNRHELDPNRLRLEITETTLISATQHTRNALDVLRAAGVGIGIDDFGTGYSSLTYLRDLPVTFVKIDQSFISGLLGSSEDAAIVRAVVRLAQALGKTVVAEGVELAGQAETLEELGCDALQGFLFGEGVPAADVSGARERALPSVAA